MKESILSIIKELEFATFDEIKKALGDDTRKKTLEDNLREMELAGEIIKILPDENKLSKEGYIPGPNLDVEENIETRRLLLDEGLSSRRDVINWEIIFTRLVSELSEKVEWLMEDINKLYKDPKTLEMEYFDYSLRYHEIYRMFNEKLETGSLKLISEQLKNCRSRLDNLNYKGTP